MTTKTVVVVSGGMDSSTLLHYVKKMLRYDDIYALSFIYGQRHTKEIECAVWQCESVGVKEHKIVDLSFLKDMLSSALINENLDLPGRESIGDPQPVSYVPNRNMIMLSIAVGYAESLGIDTVHYGAQQQDIYGYWDATDDFVSRINSLLALNRKRRVTVAAPFISMGKKEIARLGLKLGVDYSHTWTCYKGGGKACGKCLTCLERLKAFKLLGKEDPLEYEV